MPNEPYTGDGKGSAHPFIKAIKFLAGTKKKTRTVGKRDSRLRTIGDVGGGKHRKGN